MGIVSCLILPHGAMTFDGNPNGGSSTTERVKVISELQRRDCNALFAACSKAAEAVKATSPDVIVLNTPHGMCLSGAIGVYLNARAKGNAEWNGQWTEFEVDVALDTDLSKKLLDHLQNDGIAAEGITAFIDSPLRWGEVIPLYFLQDFTRAGVKVVITSNPFKTRREFETLSETTHLGHSIAKFLGALDQRVLYVVSGDLAHTHETDCQLPLYLPHPSANLPASDTALPFDLAVENWVKGVTFSAEHAKGPLKSLEEKPVKWDGIVAKEAAQWLSKAISLKGSALSCGIYGFAVLHHLILAEIEKPGTSFTSHFLCRLAPTYYGMMVATFVKDQ